MTDQNQEPGDVEESADSESEDREFELEGQMTREEGAAILRRVADGVENGSVALGGDKGSVSIPEQFEMEVEYEEEDDETELEVELEWPTADGDAAPTEEPDEDEGDETEENNGGADDEE